MRARNTSDSASQRLSALWEVASLISAGAIRARFSENRREKRLEHVEKVEVRLIDRPGSGASEGTTVNISSRGMRVRGLSPKLGLEVGEKAAIWMKSAKRSVQPVCVTDITDGQVGFGRDSVYPDQPLVDLV